MKIVTYAMYEDLFSSISEDIEENLYSLISDFDPIESICYSSFLNAYCQTTYVDDLITSQLRGKGALFRPEDLGDLVGSTSILIYHRDNLLSYISRIISRDVNGNQTITANGKGFDQQTCKYGKSLLLLNSELNNLESCGEFVLERKMIRNYPHDTDPNFIFLFYKNSFLRYRKIYFELTKNLKSGVRGKWKSIINKFRNLVGISLEDYMNTLKLLLIWFFGVGQKKLEAPHFDPDNHSTFYIVKNNFKNSPNFIKIIHSLSKNLNEIRDYFKQNKNVKIDNNFYKYFPYIFDSPVFRINQDMYCIIDLLFLLEGACSGLFWKLMGDANARKKVVQDFRGVYGVLIEEYFRFLVNSIFGTNTFVEGEGKPDFELEVELNGVKYLLIFEFTTKYYKIASLFNMNTELFEEDLDQILFDPQKDGKLAKLGKYSIEYKKKFPNSNIIPILVTEKNFGDYDLLNRNNQQLDKGIKKYHLEYLKKSNPIILNLFDLEVFWAIAENGKEKSEFLKSILKWEDEQKGKFLFSFASFVSDNKRIINDEYLKVFDTKNIAKDS